MQGEPAGGHGARNAPGSGGNANGDGVHIQLTAIRPPPARKLLAGFVLNVIGIGYRQRLHTVTGPIHRELVVGPAGIQHVDNRRIRTEPDLSFDVVWPELAHVALQIQISSSTPLQMVRVVLHAVDPRAFGSAHPELRLLHNLRGLGADTWALSLGTNDHVDQHVLTETRDALRRYAGGRFTGAVEQIREPPIPRTR